YAFTSDQLYSDGLGVATNAQWEPVDRKDWTKGIISRNTDISGDADECIVDGITDMVQTTYICNQGNDEVTIIKEPNPDKQGPCVFEFVVDSSIVCQFAQSLSSSTGAASTGAQSTAVDSTGLSSSSLSSSSSVSGASSTASATSSQSTGASSTGSPSSSSGSSQSTGTNGDSVPSSVDWALVAGVSSAVGAILMLCGIAAGAGMAFYIMRRKSSSLASSVSMSIPADGNSSDYSEALL
ncbi:hypothetical protein HDU85_002708, partial [Gaertneriomyces sp. JEL0708]